VPEPPQRNILGRILILECYSALLAHGETGARALPHSSPTASRAGKPRLEWATGMAFGFGSERDPGSGRNWRYSGGKRKMPLNSSPGAFLSL
jgi:hypothetical protein